MLENESIRARFEGKEADELIQIIQATAARRKQTQYEQTKF
jgi:hypothetical protein